jgi:hypothetical protein
VPTGRCFIASLSPSARTISTSAEKSDPFNSGAPLATILDDVVAFAVGHAFFYLHCLAAYKAAQQLNQWAFIIVQMRPVSHFANL